MGTMVYRRGGNRNLHSTFPMVFTSTSNTIGIASSAWMTGKVSYNNSPGTRTLIRTDSREEVSKLVGR